MTKLMGKGLIQKYLKMKTWKSHQSIIWKLLINVHLLLAEKSQTKM